MHYTHRQILQILTGLLLGMLTSMISTSIVSTALPTIVGDLGGQDQLSWVASATLLTMTASTPLWGKLSDLFGRKLMFQTSLLLFVLASVGAGLSRNMGELITARAVQGLGAGGLSALAQVILGDVVSPRERGRYAGYMGAVFGVSTVAGPLLGGFIVDADGLGWRWCFYACVPLAVVAFLVIQKVLTLPKVKRDTRLDVFGAFTITGGAAVLMLLLSLGGKEFAWASGWTYGLLAAAAVLLVLAVVAERIAREPILPPRLFRNPTFVLTSLASAALGCAMFGGMIYMPQFLQIVKGMSPTASGLMTLPLVLGMFVSSTASGQVVTRTGRWKAFPVIGMVLSAVAMYLLSRLHTDSGELVIGVDLTVLGFGMGLTLQILMLAAQNAADRSDLAATTSGVSFFRNLGGAMGVAGFGAVLTNRLTSELSDRMSAAGVSAPAGGRHLGSPDEIHALPEPFRGWVLDAFTNALQHVFLFGIPVTVVGLLAVLALKELPLRSGRAAAAARSDTAAGPAPAGASADGPGAAGTGSTGGHARGYEAPADAAERLVPVGAGGVLGVGIEQSPNGAAAHPSADPLSAIPNGVAPQPAASRPAATDTAMLRPQSASASELDTAPGDGDGGQLRGVVRGPGGGPVASAALTLIDVAGRQLGRALTGADGRYALRTPGPGTYVLIAASAEHEPQAATLVVGDKPLDFDLDLAGGGGLTGTVRAPDGAPVEGATVVATDVRGEVVGSARTGADGAFALREVPAGSYTVAVSAEGHRPVALQAEVAGNGATRLDVELRPGVQVRGTVRDEAGRPVADARVTLVDGAGTVVAQMITGPDGEYAFTDLTGGQYTVIASGYPPVATAVTLHGDGRDGHDIVLGHPDA
ncbi:MFS transporter [Actinomadura rubrobrunea]|uniref:MFS transporter n=1 Tax=Actinomadura rubrobrunea TaxID=115335 RepID=A0A9W6UXA2_9ACTN|nr:MFS transporter [Actinomadura rubrobrunea]GLW65898.1 MFS transporter [Actinomadura rubrobrunea]